MGARIVAITQGAVGQAYDGYAGDDVNHAHQVAPSPPVDHSVTVVAPLWLDKVRGLSFG